MKEHNMKIFPDWSTPEMVALVYPKGLQAAHDRTSRDTVLPCFHQILSALNQNENALKVLIVFQPNNGAEEKHQELQEKYSNLELLKQELPLIDIWIRDWAPLSVCNGKGTLLKSRYEPSYCFYSPTKDHLAGKHLQLEYAQTLQNIPISWEFGNLSTNGKDIIVTESLCRENGMTHEELEKTLRDYLTFDKLVIIPIEQYDTVGHVDSICRFLNESTIVLPSYPDYFVDENNYIKEVYNLLRDELEGYEYVFVDSDLSEIVNRENVYSAEGNYLNFLRLGNNIYVPQYGNGFDKNVIKTFKKHSKANIVPITRCSELAFLGGVLNCATWTIYS